MTSDRGKYGLAVRCARLGVDVGDDDPGALREAIGVRPGGALLVRPDGIVAWRVIDAPGDPTSELLAALAAVATSARV